MDDMYTLLQCDEIRSIAEAAVRHQAALKRALDPNDPLAQELEYRANRIQAKFCVRDSELQPFQIESSNRMAQTFRRWADKAVAKQPDDPSTKDLLFHANRIAGLAQERERAWEADRSAATVRDRDIARTIADAARAYAEQLLAKDRYDPTIEELIRHANLVEQEYWTGEDRSPALR